MASLNKACLIGHLGQDPEVKSLHSGDKVANFSLATSESWKDKATGERKERTQWHRIVVFNQSLINVCDNYLKKGAKIYIEGAIENRSWDEHGVKKYTTEIVLRPYRGEIIMLDTKNRTSEPRDDQYNNGYTPPAKTSAGHDELEDEIPF